MRAAVYHGEGVIRLEELPDVTPDRGEVLLDVAACGVCGSDRAIVRGHAAPPGTQFPTVLGHEIAGTVAKSTVSEWQPGDAVIVYPYIPCGTCRVCQTGLGHLCLQQTVIGYQRYGGYAERVVVPASNLVRRPDNVSAEAGALLTDAFATPYHALVSHVTNGAKSSVLVMGSGGIGLAALMLARTMGVEHVGALTRRPHGTPAALGAGAEMVWVGELEPKSLRPLSREIRRWSEGGVDVVLDTYGSESSVAAAVDLVRPGGRVVLVGMGDGAPKLPPVAHWVRREIVVAGSYGSTQTELVQLLEWTAQGNLSPERLLTRRLPLEDIDEALGPEWGGGRVVIVPNLKEVD